MIMKHGKTKTQKAALKEAQRRWGKHAAIRVREDLPANTPEKRADYEKKFHELRERRKGMTPQEKRATQNEYNELQGIVLSYPVTVGRIEMGMFLAVKGQGYTYDDAFFDADWNAALEIESFAELRVRNGEPANYKQLCAAL